VSFAGLGGSLARRCLGRGRGIGAAAAGLGKRQAGCQQHGEYNCQKSLHAISFSNPFLREVIKPRLTLYI
jgi:hypothetical protein